MIKIKKAPEPSNFDSDVRSPGNSFLRSHGPGNITQNLWSKYSYWRRILPELYKNYNGICAYSCHWMAPDTGSKQVEHFKPKSRYRDQAYEWDNYRLVCSTINSRKGIKEVLDPFEIEDGWFIIEFPTLIVKPSPNLPPTLIKKINETIKALKLNDESTCVENRKHYMRFYCAKQIDFDFLRDHAPFLASELIRQDLVEHIRPIMGYPS